MAFPARLLCKRIKSIYTLEHVTIHIPEPDKFFTSFKYL